MWRIWAAKDKKKGEKEPKSVWEELFQVKYEVGINEVWKLSNGDLIEVIKKYEDYSN